MTKLTFGCACKKVTGSVEVPAPDLPLTLEFCHCNICRHQSGSLAASFVTLPKSATPSFEVSGPVTSYESSKTLSRKFCGHCGSNVYVYTENSESPTEYDICSGALDGSGDLVKLDRQIFVADTKDGGMSPWLHQYPAWEQWTGSSRPVDCTKYGPSTHAEQTAELDCYCQCKSVEFTITRPTKASRESVSAPWSDLLSPYVPDPADNEHDVKWWLRAKDNKYLAGNCMCDSCRSVSGFDVQQWAFIPKVNILQKDGEPLDYGMGTLEQYDSSEGVHRNFCGRCGATVFYHADKRPALLDVAVGLFDATEGARAESWVEWWTKRVSHVEDATDTRNRTLARDLLAGLKRWSTIEGVPASSIGR